MLLLTTHGSVSDCVRANTSNYAVFQSLAVPTDAVTGFSGPVPTFTPQSPGKVLLYFKALGVVSKPVAITVTDVPDHCRVVSMPHNATQTLFQVVPAVTVRCGLDSGSAMPGVLLAARLRLVVNNSCAGRHLSLNGKVTQATNVHGEAVFDQLVIPFGQTGEL